MTTTCFISYRRDDPASEAGRLHSTLLREFQGGTVSMDTSGIGPGTKWPQALEEASTYLGEASRNQDRVDAPARIVALTPESSPIRDAAPAAG